MLLQKSSAKMASFRLCSILMANIITSLRIVLSMIMLFTPVFSSQFYWLYVSAGITDMVDGTVARLTGSAGEKGAKLDSAA